MHKLAFATVIAACIFASGCLCNLKPTPSTIVTLATTTTTAPSCLPLSIIYKGGCCLDENNNSICDRYENLVSSSTTSTLKNETGTLASSVPTTSTSTTTIPKASCSDGIQNQNEIMVDCAGPCKKDCDILNITLASDTAGFQGYAFNFKDVKLVKEEPAYTLQLTASDGFTDERTVSIGDQSWIDGVKFKVEDGGESFMILTARTDKQLLEKAGNASIKTIGGLSCVQTGGGMCTRSYKGYNITMINRIDGGGVRFSIRKPDGLDVIGTAYQNGTTYMLVGHEGIIVGVLNYMIPGGYSNIWVKMR